MALRCPYCFEQLERSEVAFRCAGTGGSCTPEEDVALAQHEGAARAPILPRVFKLRRFSHRFGGPKDAVCRCGGRTTARVCPRCHSPWPPDYETTDNVLIAVVGEREVGKSTYVAALIDELMHAAARFGATFSYAGADSAANGEQKSISPTLLRTPKPLIYRLRFDDGRVMRSVRVVTVVLYDTAGNHFGDAEWLAAYGRCLAAVEGLICIIDPLQIAAVRPFATTNCLPKSVGDPMKTIDGLDRMIRGARTIGPYARIDIPAAVTFSKVDAIRSIFARGSVVHRNSLHHRFFDISDAGQMHDAMRYQSSRWLGPEFDRFVSHKFAMYSFFTVSAGDKPDGAPFRVQDPFWWLMYKRSVVRGKKTTRDRP